MVDSQQQAAAASDFAGWKTTFSETTTGSQARLEELRSAFTDDFNNDCVFWMDAALCDIRCKSFIHDNDLIGSICAATCGDKSTVIAEILTEVLRWNNARDLVECLVSERNNRIVILQGTMLDRLQTGRKAEPQSLFSILSLYKFKTGPLGTRLGECAESYINRGHGSLQELCYLTTCYARLDIMTLKLMDIGRFQVDFGAYGGDAENDIRIQAYVYGCCLLSAVSAAVCGGDAACISRILVQYVRWTSADEICASMEEDKQARYDTVVRYVKRELDMKKGVYVTTLEFEPWAERYMRNNVFSNLRLSLDSSAREYVQTGEGEWSEICRSLALLFRSEGLRAAEDQTDSYLSCDNWRNELSPWVKDVRMQAFQHGCCVISAVCAAVCGDRAEEVSSILRERLPWSTDSSLVGCVYAEQKNRWNTLAASVQLLLPATKPEDISAAVDQALRGLVWNQDVSSTECYVLTGDGSVADAAAALARYWRSSDLSNALMKHLMLGFEPTGDIRTLAYLEGCCILSAVSHATCKERHAELAGVLRRELGWEDSQRLAECLRDEKKDGNVFWGFGAPEGAGEESGFNFGNWDTESPLQMVQTGEVGGFGFGGNISGWGAINSFNAPLDEDQKARKDEIVRCVKRELDMEKGVHVTNLEFEPWAEGYIHNNLLFTFHVFDNTGAREYVRSGVGGVSEICSSLGLLFRSEGLRAAEDQIDPDPYFHALEDYSRFAKDVRMQAFQHGCCVISAVCAAVCGDRAEEVSSILRERLPWSTDSSLVGCVSAEYRNRRNTLAASVQLLLPATKPEDISAAVDQALRGLVWNQDVSSTECYVLTGDGSVADAAAALARYWRSSDLSNELMKHLMLGFEPTGDIRTLAYLEGCCILSAVSHATCKERHAELAGVLRRELGWEDSQRLVECVKDEWKDANMFLGVGVPEGADMGRLMGFAGGEESGFNFGNVLATESPFQFDTGVDTGFGGFGGATGVQFDSSSTGGEGENWLLFGTGDAAVSFGFEGETGIQHDWSRAGRQGVNLESQTQSIWNGNQFDFQSGSSFAGGRVKRRQTRTAGLRLGLFSGGTRSDVSADFRQYVRDCHTDAAIGEEWSESVEEGEEGEEGGLFGERDSSNSVARGYGAAGGDAQH